MAVHYLSNSHVSLKANNGGGIRYATTRDAVIAALTHLQQKLPPGYVLAKIWVDHASWEEKLCSMEAHKGSANWQEGHVHISLCAQTEPQEIGETFDFNSSVNTLVDSLLELRLLRAHVDDILNG